MASSYLTSAQKDLLSNRFFNIHATLSPPISIFRTTQQIVFTPNASNNYIFESAPFNDVVEPVLVSGVFNARIRYPSTHLQDQFASNSKGRGADQVNVRPEAGTIALRFGLDKSGISGLNGRLQRWGFWKRVLTAADRLLLYNNGNGLAYPFTGQNI